MFDLTGRTALVTGATGSIGGAIAQAMHKQGATVTISGTRREVLDGFAASLRECEDELRSTLEDWILVGLKFGHKLPVLAGIDLNKVQNGRMATT